MLAYLLSIKLSPKISLKLSLKFSPDLSEPTGLFRMLQYLYQAILRSQFQCSFEEYPTHSDTLTHDILTPWAPFVAKKWDVCKKVLIVFIIFSFMLTYSSAVMILSN